MSMQFLNRNQLDFVGKECWGDEAETPQKPRRSQIADLQANWHRARSRAEGWARGEEAERIRDMHNPENHLELSEYVAKRVKEATGVDCCDRHVLPFIQEQALLDPEQVEDLIEWLVERCIEATDDNYFNLLADEEELKEANKDNVDDKDYSSSELQTGGSSTAQSSWKTVMTTTDSGKINKGFDKNGTYARQSRSRKKLRHATSTGRKISAHIRTLRVNNIACNKELSS